MVLPALVVGSLSPDFEYFVYLRPERSISHDLVGVPLMDVPLGLLALWLFDAVLKRPMAQLLPRPLRERVFPACGPVRWPIPAVLGWLAVGAFSHLAWDAFTHGGGWVVGRVPALSASPLPGIRVYHLLHFVSTVVGLALLAYWSWSWVRRQVPVPGAADSEMPSTTRAAVAITLVGIALASGPLAAYRDFHEPTAPRGYVLARFLIATIAAFLAGSLAYSVGYRGLRRR